MNTIVYMIAHSRYFNEHNRIHITLMIAVRASAKWISTLKLPCFISWKAPASDMSGVRSNPIKVFSLDCFVDRCLSFCPFSFGHCDVCPMASDYSFNIFKLFSQIICTKKTELLMEISEWTVADLCVWYAWYFEIACFHKYSERWKLPTIKF